MNRENKFRAWIAEGYYVDENDNPKFEMCYDLEWDCDDTLNDLLANTENLMSYIGKKDKNNKDIYEGDFVRDDSGKIYRVYWSKNRCAYRFKEINGIGIYKYIMPFDCKNIEIIGNIHQNPEILGDR